MGKFHRTKAGRIEPCAASVRACPLGSESHYQSLAEAVAAPRYDSQEVERSWEEALAGDRDADRKMSFIERHGLELHDGGVYAQGEYGDFVNLKKEDQERFTQILDRTDWNADSGGHDTVWVAGEPIDGAGAHQFFGCLNSGLDVIESSCREFGSYDQVAPWQEPILLEEALAMRQALREIEARS